MVSDPELNACILRVHGGSSDMLQLMTSGIPYSPRARR